MRDLTVIGSCLLAVVAFAPTPSWSAEGGLSNYLPGYYGDFAVAVTPRPGLYLYATSYSYNAQTEGPKIPDSVSLDGHLGIIGFQSVHKIDSDFSIGFGGYTTRIDATLEWLSASVNDQTSEFGDSSISPIVFYWSSGRFHASLYEAIILPTGVYDRTKPLNSSRNYTSFDTVLALTWLDSERGIELSVVPGLMFNTENTATDYQTGAELHVDGMLNLYLSKNLALGLHGYYYNQIEEDSGRGVPAADIRGLAYGIGPTFLYVPQELGVDGKIVGKWLHEVEGQNRFIGDILSLTFAVKF